MELLTSKCELSTSGTVAWTVAAAKSNVKRKRIPDFG